MSDGTTAYDPRYLAGILFFNAGDYFEAHEVWESIWLETSGPERKFYQGLIQAAVGLLHLGNGNHRGALKLSRSSRDYLRTYQPTFLGLDVAGLIAAMDRHFAPLETMSAGASNIAAADTNFPEIQLDPAPDLWPNPSDYVEADE